MKTLYLFIDESGNLDFSSKGTKYFILSVLSTIGPYEVSAPLLNLRYGLLPNCSGGPGMEENGYFHASEDAQAVRDRVFSIVSKLAHPIRVDSIVAQKNKAAPIFHTNQLHFYRTLGETSLKYAFTRADWQGYEHVVVVFSSLFDRKKRGILKQAFKALIKQHAQVPFSLYFHDSKFDLCNQAVDYFGWAIYRKWELSDVRSYDLIKHHVKSEFQIFEKGGTEFYPYKK